jgi:outer membrane protein assembly factor BamB
MPATRRGFLESVGCVGVGLSGCLSDTGNTDGSSNESEPNETQRDDKQKQDSAPKKVSASGSWPQFQYDETNRSYNPQGPTLDESTEVTTLFSREEGSFGSPVVSEGMLYVKGEYGNVHAIDATTGERLWATMVGAMGNVSSGERLVFVSGVLQRNTLHALDFEKGEVVWSFRGQRSTESAPLIHNGSVFFGDDSGTVYSLEHSTGEMNWENEVKDGYWMMSSAASDDLVCTTDLKGGVYAFEASTGEMIWDTKLETLHCGPVISEDTVYVSEEHEYEGRIHAFDKQTGEKLWEFESSDKIYSAPAVAGGRIYVASYEEGFMFGIDADNGEELWREETSGTYPYGPSVSGESIIFPSLSGLYVFDPSGEEVWSEGGYYDRPAVVDGAVYVGTGDGGVLALG